MTASFMVGLVLLGICALCLLMAAYWLGKAAGLREAQRIRSRAHRGEKP